MPISPLRTHRVSGLLRVGGFVVLLGALLMLGRHFGHFVPEFAERVELMGNWAPVAFIAGYIVGTLVFIPGSLISLAAGAIFGVPRGTLYVFIGASIAETIAFLLARYGARSFIERQFSRSPRFKALGAAVASAEFKIVLLLRLSPLIPFNLLNYALGLTRVSLANYVMASIAVLPGTLLFVYYGKAAGDIAALASGVVTPRGTGYYVLLFVGLLATILVSTIIARTANRALNVAKLMEQTSDEGTTLR
jgi:uncharacterized membrane protein YdjX (TVP38/TMEM64 family)